MPQRHNSLPSQIISFFYVCLNYFYERFWNNALIHKLWENIAKAASFCICECDFPWSLWNAGLTGTSESGCILEERLLPPWSRGSWCLAVTGAGLCMGSAWAVGSCPVTQRGCRGTGLQTSTSYSQSFFLNPALFHSTSCHWHLISLYCDLKSRYYVKNSS